MSNCFSIEPASLALISGAAIGGVLFIVLVLMTIGIITVAALRVRKRRKPGKVIKFVSQKSSILSSSSCLHCEQ